MTMILVKCRIALTTILVNREKENRPPNLSEGDELPASWSGRGGLPFGIRNVLLHQLVLDKSAEQGIEHGAERNEEQHACNAHEFAAQGHGGQHPDRGKPHRRAYHVGIDQIPFHLLEDQEEDDEQQSFPGIGNGNEQCAYRAAMKAPTMGIRAVREISTPTSRA